MEITIIFQGMTDTLPDEGYVSAPAFVVFVDQVYEQVPGVAGSNEYACSKDRLVFYSTDNIKRIIL
jgi:hypothetical protein